MDTPRRWTDILAPTQRDLGRISVETQFHLKKQGHGKASNLKVLTFGDFKAEVLAICNAK